MILEFNYSKDFNDIQYVNMNFIVWVLGSKEIEKIQAIKEKNVSVEIMDLMLHKSSNHNYASSSTSERHPWLMQGFPHRFELKVEGM